tara:strand:+ start:1848 stop:2699 length:852 start_codon:yes stop_codon:yes gene_type:complete
VAVTLSPTSLPFSLPAPAKINLCLLILGRRANGYHDLQTAFQILDLEDQLLFEESEVFTVSGLEGVAETENLVYRAGMLLANQGGVKPTGKISIIKRIPMGAGLGGGSSNAASALVGLNLLWNCGLSLAELAVLGAQLGADVPVFVHGCSAWGEGLGEALTPLELPDATYLLVYPNCHVSTAEVFSHPDLTRDSSAITIARFLSLGAGNDCENIVCRIYPEVGKVRNWLNQWGPAKMTGTGSCVFLRCESPEQAKAIQEEVPSEWQSFVTKGVNRSPLLALKS